MTRTRTPQRMEFLSDLVTIAIENGGYGWFSVDEYRWEDQPDGAYAVIRSVDIETPDHTARVDIDTIARGISVIRDARPQVDARYPKDGPVLHNTTTRQRLYLSAAMRTTILDASRESDASELDAIGALAIVECALFGAVTFA